MRMIKRLFLQYFVCPCYGPELVTNGDASDTTYIDSSVHALVGFLNIGTHNANNKFTIESNQFHLISDGTYTAIGSPGLTIGLSYRIQVTVSTVISGILSMRGNSIYLDISSPGIYSFNIIADNATLTIARSGVSNIIFDNISVKEIL